MMPLLVIILSGMGLLVAFAALRIKILRPPPPPSPVRLPSPNVDGHTSEEQGSTPHDSEEADEDVGESEEIDDE